MPGQLGTLALGLPLPLAVAAAPVVWLPPLSVVFLANVPTPNLFYFSNATAKVCGVVTLLKFGQKKRVGCGGQGTAQVGYCAGVAGVKRALFKKGLS